MIRITSKLQWVHSFLHIATTLSQTRQRNGIIRRCAKGLRDVQNAARAAEKNAPNKFAVTGRLIVTLEFFIVSPILSDLAIFHYEPYSVRLDNFAEIRIIKLS